MPALNAYRQLEDIRYRLPTYHPHDRAPQHADNILAIADDFDVFWFDALGVLNVGPVAIDGAVQAVAALRAAAPIVVRDCANVATSFPSFRTLAQSVGMAVRDA